MSKMREVTIKSSSTNVSDHESNLDALLEDLHTTVSRSNSSSNLNGGGLVTTGYRSVRRTMTDGTPEGTRSEYHVEYLDPANSVQHVTESSYHSGNLNSADKGNANRSINESYKYRSEMSSSDSRTKKNISELDSLLDDLNVAQKKSFASNSTVSTMNATSGFDSGLLEPVSSTPHSTRAYEKRYREEKTVRRERSSSPRRELVFTGTRSRDPSPIDHHTSYEQREQTPTVQQFYRYEKTTSTRTTAPVVTTEVLGGNDSSRLYTSDTPLAIKQRPPSPSGPQYTQTDGYGKTSSYNYSSSSTREARSDHRTTSPHRPQSPPVSFQQPLQPTLSKNRSFRDQSPPPPPRSQSPQRFSPSDPSHRSPYSPSQQSTISSYKYSSNMTTTNNYRDESLARPRPFPTDPPQEQQPPKQLEELLATLSGSDTTNDHFSREYSRHHQQTTVEHNSHRSPNDLQKPSTPMPPPPPHQPQVPEPQKYREEIREKTVVRKEVGSNNQKTDVTPSLTGPPVYYPPGVELFSKKEEEAMMQQKSGGMYKAKAKYEYEAKSKSKSKESSGKVVVPVCLPLCCGAPCSIM